jgi:hypothetical protein
MGSTLKQLYDETWVVDRQLNEWKVEPLLKGKEAHKAHELYDWFGQVYGLNGKSSEIIQHEALDEVML